VGASNRRGVKSAHDSGIRMLPDCKPRHTRSGRNNKEWHAMRMSSPAPAHKAEGPLMMSGPSALCHEALCLEGCGNGQAEGFARLPELVLRSISLYRFGICIVSRAARREHVAGNQLRRATALVTTDQNIIAGGRLIEPQRLNAK